MNKIENFFNAQNEANAIRKIAIEEKKRRVLEEGEKEGEPTKEDYEYGDKTLTMELAELAKEGSEEFEEITKSIDEKFAMQMEKSNNYEKEPKKLLILECTGMDDVLGKLIVLSDERLGATNVDMIDVTTKADELPANFDEISGIVISGSASDIVEKNEKQWIGKIEKFVEKGLEKNVPVLGICFGIQVHADMKGREVPKNEGGREMGVWNTSIYLDEKEAEHPIFKGIDFKEEKNGQEIKKSAILETTGSHAYHVEYDPKAQHDSMHGFNFTQDGYYYPMVETDGAFVGLQFHPELSGAEGLAFLKCLVKKRSDKLIADGKDPKEILKRLDEYEAEISSKQTHDNVRFLQNFVSMVFEKK